MSYFNSIISSVGISLIGIMSMYIITGMTGMFSLGQASFMAVGAYVAGILAVNLKLPFALCLVAAVVVGALVGFLVGLPTTRLRKDYIALVTLAFGEAIIAILNNLTAFGGAMGLSGIPKRTTPALVIISVVLIAGMVWQLKKSRFGRQCMALKDDPLAAKSMGIDVDRIKLMSFTLASGVTAYAGALYAFNTTYLDPTAFTWNVSAEWIIILVFGGINSLTGALTSGVLLGLLPELLRAASEWRIIIYCVIVLLIINFRPQGLFGNYELNLRTLGRDVKRLFTKRKNINEVKK